MTYPRRKLQNKGYTRPTLSSQTNDKFLEATFETGNCQLRGERNGRQILEKNCFKIKLMLIYSPNSEGFYQSQGGIDG